MNLPRTHADPATLRRAAEERLQQRPPAALPQNDADLHRLRHELEVHQIELEMQNEELRTAHAEISAGLERYTDLFDFAPVGYFNLAADGTIQLANLTGARLLDTERGRLIGRRFNLFVRESDRTAFTRFLSAAFTSGTKQQCELALHRAPARVSHVRLEGTLSPDGKECRAVMTDITSWRQLEEQLRQSQKMEAIGQLAGGVAHDFNNLLTVIHGNASVLQTKRLSADQERDALAEISQASIRAAALIRQLLTFSRRQAPALQPLELNRIVAHLAKMLRRTVPESVTVQLRLHPNPLHLRADPGMLDQVVLNLVLNARDAMPDGGLLSIETSEYDVTEADPSRLPDGVVGRHVRMRISDTGCGIPEKNLPHIFEPFFTTKPLGKGTGLGLATVFGIVRQHAGSIRVASEAGGGSVFDVLLPAATEAEARPNIGAAPDRMPDGAESILVVDDEEPVGRFVKRILEAHGYHVQLAHSGADALAQWEQARGSIDLVLTDVIMPGGMSGLELAERLHEQKPGLKVLFMSGYTGDSVGRGVQLREGDNFLAKPFVSAPFLRWIRSHLDAS